MKNGIILFVLLATFYAFPKGPVMETRHTSLHTELVKISSDTHLGDTKKTLILNRLNKGLSSKIAMRLLRKPLQKAASRRTNMEPEQSKMLIAGIILLVISVTLLSIALFNPALDSTLFSIFIGVGVPLGCFAFLAFLGLITYSDYN